MNTLATMLKTLAILAALAGPVWCVVVTVPENFVETTVGGNVTLLCSYRTETVLSNSLFFQWRFYSAKRKEMMVVCYSQEGQSYSYGEFRGRIQVADEKGNASITIFNVQPSETGVYSCEVFNPAGPNGQNVKSVALSVLAPPSRPHCSLHGTPEMGHLISLNCFSEEGLPPPTYLWQKLSGGTIMPVTESYNPKTGIMVISRLTNYEEGCYRCTAVNSLGKESCQIHV